MNDFMACFYDASMGSMGAALATTQPGEFKWQFLKTCSQVCSLTENTNITLAPVTSIPLGNEFAVTNLRLTGPWYSASVYYANGDRREIVYKSSPFPDSGICGPGAMLPLSELRDWVTVVPQQGATDEILLSYDQVIYRYHDYATNARLSYSIVVQDHRAITLNTSQHVTEWQCNLNFVTYSLWLGDPDGVLDGVMLKISNGFNFNIHGEYDPQSRGWVISFATPDRPTQTLNFSRVRHTSLQLSHSSMATPPNLLLIQLHAQINVQNHGLLHAFIN